MLHPCPRAGRAGRSTHPAGANTHLSAAAVTHHRCSRREEKKYKGCARGVRLFAQRVIMGCRGGDPPRERQERECSTSRPPGYRHGERPCSVLQCTQRPRPAKEEKFTTKLPRTTLATGLARRVSLARVSGRRPPRAREHMLPGHSMGSGRIHSSVKVGDEKRNPRSISMGFSVRPRRRRNPG